MKKKGQSAIEFVILAAFVLMVFTVMFLVIQGNTADEIRKNKNLAMNDLALAIQGEIALASEASEGYFRFFDIPDKLNNQDYSVEILDQDLYIKTSDNKFAMSLAVHRVTGNVKKGENLIKKQNGAIYLN